MTAALAAIRGTVYGVVLNDARERQRLAAAFRETPYKAPPVAPVLYVKTRNCLRESGEIVTVPADVPALEVNATLALLIARAAGVGATVADCVGGYALALDVCEPHDSYFRPAVRQRCRDGFLPMGAFVPWLDGLETLAIETSVDDKLVHRRSLVDLHRPVSALLADVGLFMTLEAGDVLLVGLSGDAPQVRPGQRVVVRASGLPSLTASFAGAGDLA